MKIGDKLFSIETRLPINGPKTSCDPTLVEWEVSKIELNERDADSNVVLLHTVPAGELTVRYFPVDARNMAPSHFFPTAAEAYAYAFTAKQDYLAALKIELDGFIATYHAEESRMPRTLEAFIRTVKCQTKP